jgi:hypothetical protein
LPGFSADTTFAEEGGNALVAARAQYPHFHFSLKGPPFLIWTR